MESRVELAVGNFEQGYSCCQSVFAAYADIYGIDRETALKMAGPLGAGVGRMREVCGAVLAMSLLSGFEHGNAEPTEESKEHCYQFVRRMSDSFREKQGSIICRELLGLPEGVTEPPKPSERTQEYYESRPCLSCIRSAAEIVEEMLFTK